MIIPNHMAQLSGDLPETPAHALNALRSSARSDGRNLNCREYQTTLSQFFGGKRK